MNIRYLHQPILKSWALTIIAVGITIGFLLGMSVIALLRAPLSGDSAGLEISFTALTGLMTAMLVTYVFKSVHCTSPVLLSSFLHKKRQRDIPI